MIWKNLLKFKKKNFFDTEILFLVRPLICSRIKKNSQLLSQRFLAAFSQKLFWFFLWIPFYGFSAATAMHFDTAQLSSSCLYNHFIYQCDWLNWNFLVVCAKDIIFSFFGCVCKKHYILVFQLCVHKTFLVFIR
jgi:hypothetical protein